ncbi:hypothetical protein [Desulfosarcina sp.]|uniref:hypothetical protein n=1 Tax=Desulfosarcina sp. TaxID=2027861 RepID=UPI003970D9BC
MAWTRVSGLAGKVYLPDIAGQMQKKHPCSSCFSCQWCDENRCQVCRCPNTNSCEPDPLRCRDPHRGEPEKRDRP